MAAVITEVLELDGGDVIAVAGVVATLIGTLGASYLGYHFEERREVNRQRRSAYSEATVALEALPLHIAKALRDGHDLTPDLILALIGDPLSKLLLLGSTDVIENARDLRDAVDVASLGRDLHLYKEIQQQIRQEKGGMVTELGMDYSDLDVVRGALGPIEIFRKSVLDAIHRDITK